MFDLDEFDDVDAKFLSIARGQDEDLAAYLVRLVRAGLDANGHNTVPIDVRWVMFKKLADGHYRLMLNVPIGRHWELPLLAQGDLADLPVHRLINEFASDLVCALPNVQRARRMLARFVKAALLTSFALETSAARNKAPYVAVRNTSLKEILAIEMVRDCWQDAARRVQVYLHVKVLNHDLDDEVILIPIDSHKQVEVVMKDLLPEQSLRRLERWRSRVPDWLPTVSAVCIDLLKSFGFDPVEVLSRFQEVPGLDLPVSWEGRATKLAIVTYPSSITARIIFSDKISWNGSSLVLRCPKLARAAKVGRLVSDFFTHPAFFGLKVLYVNRNAHAKETWATIDVPIYRFHAVNGVFVVGPQPGSDPVSFT